MIRRTFFFTALFLGLGTLASAQQVNFAGTWRLDDRASQITTGDGLEGLGSHAPDNLYITQRRDGAMIMASRLPGSEPRAYQLDGSSWVQAPRPGTAKLLMSSRTRGLSMTSEANGEVDGEPVSVREVMTIDRTGRRITIVVTTTRSSGPETNKLVYMRVGGGGSR